MSSLRALSILFLIFTQCSIISAEHCRRNDTVFVLDVHPVSPEDLRFFTLQYVLYSSIGIFTTISNVFLFIAICRFSALVKKYFLVLFLAGGDLSVGLAYTISGFQRLFMVYTGTHKVLVTQWTCMIRLYTVFFTICYAFPPQITTVISLERFLAITWPIKFAKTWPTKKIFVSAAIFCIFLTLSYLGVAMSNAWNSEECYENFCFTNWGNGPELFAFMNNFIICCAVVTVVTYTGATYSMIKQRKRLRDGSHNNSSRYFKKQVEHQIRVTKQFLVIVVTTTVCVMTPMIMSSLLIGLDRQDLYVLIIPFLWSIHAFNSGINLIVYALTNPELRRAFRSVLPCWYKAVGEVVPAASLTERHGTMTGGGRSRAATSMYGGHNSKAGPSTAPIVTPRARTKKY